MKEKSKTDIDTIINLIKNKGKQVGSFSQTKNEMNIGKRKEWEKSIPADEMSDLTEGKHTISVMAIDSKGQNSAVKEIVVKVPKHVTKIPQIEITSPAETSEEHPYNPGFKDKIDLGGTWSDLDSEKINIFYSIDDSNETPLHKNIENDV